MKYGFLLVAHAVCKLKNVKREPSRGFGDMPT